jgi:hypothetical protein
MVFIINILSKYYNEFQNYHQHIIYWNNNKHNIKRIFGDIGRLRNNKDIRRHNLIELTVKIINESFGFTVLHSNMKRKRNNNSEYNEYTVKWNYNANINKFENGGIKIHNKMWNDSRPLEKPLIAL